MNLLDKKMLGLIVLSALAFFSCEEENELGSNINPAEDRLQIEFQEFTLPSLNVFLDSVRTDLDSYILVGGFNDEVYGNIRAEGYANLNIVSNLNAPDSTAILDSVVVNLGLDFNNYFTDNIIQTHELTVSMIADTLFAAAVPLSSERANVIDGSVIGNTTFMVNPAADSSISFQVDLAYGEILLDELEELEDLNSLIFPVGALTPLAFSTSESSTSLIGFNRNDVTMSNLVLHYHTPTEDSLTFEFNFGAGGAYNYVSVDRSQSTVFSSVTGDELQVIDDVTGDFIYMNPITGIVPMVNLEGVNQFFSDRLVESDSSISVLSAQLIMPIDPSDTSAFMQVAEDLIYYFSTEEGRINGGGARLDPAQHIILTNESYLTPQIVNEARGVFEEESFAIERDVTLFTQLMIENRINADRTAPFPRSLVMIPTVVSSLRQTRFFRDGIKLRVFYTVLN